MGQPIDGKGAIQATERRPIEHPAPGIADRQSVNEPLQTGLKPLMRWYQSAVVNVSLSLVTVVLGKTAIALDTIINQKVKMLFVSM